MTSITVFDGSGIVEEGMQRYEAASGKIGSTCGRECGKIDKGRLYLRVKREWLVEIVVGKECGGGEEEERMLWWRREEESETVIHVGSSRR
jgi:hypothetical protein